MRVIKFRHYFPSTGVVTAGHDPVTLILTSTGKEDFWKEAVWMQYTGLKDKNGKEIYELSEINGRYRVEFRYNRYILQHISNSDIYIEFSPYDEYEITREYSPIQKD